MSILYIPNVFLGNTQISSNTYFGHLFGGVCTFVYHPHPLLSLRKSKITLNVIDVIVLEKSWSINVANVISTCTIIVYRKDKCCFCFYSILDLVHKIFGAWISSNNNAVSFLAPWLRLDINTFTQVMVVCIWLYLPWFFIIKLNALLRKSIIVV